MPEKHSQRIWYVITSEGRGERKHIPQISLPALALQALSPDDAAGVSRYVSLAVDPCFVRECIACARSRLSGGGIPANSRYAVYIAAGAVENATNGARAC